MHSLRLFPRRNGGVLTVLQVRASIRRWEDVGEDVGVGENVRRGVGGGDAARVVHVREHMTHVGNVHLNSGSKWESTRKR